MPELDLPPMWDAHDHPGRPLDSCAMFCACIDCEAAIRAEAERHPKRVFWLKTAYDRIAVTAEYLVESFGPDGSLHSLLYVEDDDVREIYLPVEETFFWFGERWWSMTCHEDDVADGRRRRRHKVAKRRSKATRERARVRWEAEHPPGPQSPPVAFTPLAEAVAPVRRAHRAFITTVVEWSLASGSPLDPDRVALLCAGIDGAYSRDRSFTRWTRDRVATMLRIDVNNWCALHRCLQPDEMPETLWGFLTCLADTERLDKASHPVHELYKALRCMAGIGDDGRPLPDDAPRERCECYRPYDGPTHGEVRRSCA